LALAKRFVDWLVKTGQNHVQWYLLRDVSFSDWRPRGQAIRAYAHARGVTVGVVVQLWSGSSLQRAVELVKNKDNWQNEMSASFDQLMVLPWDNVEIALGEFFA